MLKMPLLLVGILILSGCIREPNIPKYSMSQNAKIGYIVKVKPYPTHTHIGTTVFNNFSKVYKYDWGMHSYIKNQLVKKIKTKKLEPVDLSLYGFSLEDLQEIVISSDGKWHINPSKKPIYNRLKKMNIKALILIYDGVKIAYLECGAFGCAERYAKGYGLLTRSMLNLDGYIPATAFFTHTYLVQPPVKIDAKYQKNRNDWMLMVRTPFTSKEEEQKMGFIEPKDFYHLTKQEMVLYEKKIKKYIQTQVNDIVEALSH